MCCHQAPVHDGVVLSAVMPTILVGPHVEKLPSIPVNSPHPPVFMEKKLGAWEGAITPTGGAASSFLPLASSPHKQSTTDLQTLKGTPVQTCNTEKRFVPRFRFFLPATLRRDASSVTFQDETPSKPRRRGRTKQSRQIIKNII